MFFFVCFVLGFFGPDQTNQANPWVTTLDFHPLSSWFTFFFRTQKANLRIFWQHIFLDSL